MVTEIAVYIAIYIAIGMALCTLCTWVLGEEPDSLSTLLFVTFLWPLCLFLFFLMWVAETSASRKSDR